MVGVLWIFRNAAPAKAHRRFRLAQTASAAAMALGHGLQDAQKTMGVICLALLTAGWASPATGIPLWVKLVRRRPRSPPAPTPAAGASCARSAARSSSSTRPAASWPSPSSALVLYVNAFALHAPGLDHAHDHLGDHGRRRHQRLSAVRWGVAKNIAIAWVLTIPAAALVAALATWALWPFLT